VAKTYTPISITANTKIISAAASKKTYVCSSHLVSASADNVALVEGTGTTCATSTAGVAGGATAATGWNLGANGGLVVGDGSAVAIGGQGTNVDVCLFVSGATQVSGQVAWVQQ